MLPRSTLRTLACLAALAGGPALAAGVSFTHKDWELACDNTRTCRAAGYQADDDANALSVLLTRKAGAAQPVAGRVRVGVADEQNTPPALQLAVGGRALGRVSLDRQTATGDLDAAQVAAVLSAATGSGSIVFSAGTERWRLSAAGATAVLLKMDEAQGRIGTAGALVRKGSASEAAVPAPAPAPVVQAAAVPGGELGDAALASAIRRALPEVGEDCPDQKHTEERPTLRRLAPGKVLLSLRCWRAAYNEGYGFWVASEKPPFRPVLVTTSGNDFDVPRARIVSSQKGRGIGDCWSASEWVWDGARFVHTGELTTGMCKSVAPGTWVLPTLVTDVRPARGDQSEEKRK